MALDYVLLTSAESYGRHAYGIKIFIASDALPNLSGDSDKQWEEGSLNDIGYRAQASIMNALQVAVIGADPATQEHAAQNRADIISLFKQPIFVEETPNGYASSDPYFKHFPWYVITTKIGRFKIGWRKRVMHVEWTETLCKQTAEELFPGEETTKHNSVIHAWSMEKAQEYVNKVLAST